MSEPLDSGTRELIPEMAFGVGGGGACRYVNLCIVQIENLFYTAGLVL